MQSKPKLGRRRLRPPSVYRELWDAWTRPPFESTGTAFDWDRLVAVVQRRPKTARYSDDSRRGMILLHLVCALDPPLQAVKAVLEVYPDAIDRKSHTGLTPLHVACGRNASVTVVRSLIQQRRSVIFEKDECGQTAMHWACRSDVSKDIVLLLLRTDVRMAHAPKATSSLSANRKSASPLTIVYQNRRSDSIQVLDESSYLRDGWGDNQWQKLTNLLWATHYGTVVARNGQTCSILHASLALNCPSHVIRTVMSDTCQTTYGVSDIHGNLPLHYAVKASNVRGDMLNSIVRSFPLAASMRDSWGRLPLHTALENRKNWSGGVHELYKAYPLANTLLDPSVVNPAVLLAAKHNCDVETIFCLLREYPQLLLRS